eukprot:TRINITY_DN1821_c0_g1_i4.p1 TRINITY_DN1821_c0_g1~~TRINITY_DN1821_c0_g1_i4.p1  ORF type:complete len:134 (+),score=7.95 TRINITY_DN1821_c0_g1_i4:1066-1467(+)
MEHAEKGSTLPLQNNDEFEEAENGHRKKDAVTIASSATYERDLAMAEEKRRESGMPWKVAHLSQDGILGYREVILCPCLHTRHAHRLAVYVLCTQLTQLQKGFVHSGGLRRPESNAGGDFHTIRVIRGDFERT